MSQIHHRTTHDHIESEEIRQIFHELIDLDQIIVLEAEILKEQVLKNGFANRVKITDNLESVIAHVKENAHLLIKLRNTITQKENCC